MAERDDLGVTASQSLAGKERPNDPEFLEWLAGWLDLIDPILQKVFGSEGLVTMSNVSQDERTRVIAWLDGKDVQEHLRYLAAELRKAPLRPTAAQPSERNSARAPNQVVEQPTSEAGS